MHRRQRWSRRITERRGLDSWGDLEGVVLTSMSAGQVVGGVLSRRAGSDPPFPISGCCCSFAILIVAEDLLRQGHDCAPPYTDILYWVGFPNPQATRRELSVSRWRQHHVNAYLSSLKIAIVSTLLCLAIGCPMASPFRG